MKKLFVFSCWLWALGFGLTANGQQLIADSIVVERPWPRNIQARIDSIVTGPEAERSQLGLLVWDLQADSALYAYHPRHTMRPASTMKLVTAVTALDQLGARHPFSTSLYYTGEIIDSTLTGDLYVVGGMDPMFDGADLQMMVRAVREAGIDTLQGRIVCDCSMKDSLMLGEGWCWDDDNPILSPLLVNGKNLFAQRLAEALEANGVAVRGYDGTEVRGRVPGDARLLTTRTHTLQQVLMKMMKDSDNQYAESVFYQLGPTAKKASARVRQLINDVGLNGNDYRVADGSGLSLYNYISPELLVRLLRHAWRRQDIYIYLQPSLPIAGQDGTLKNRMRRSSAEGNVRAKTGTVTAVSALAGYCTAANGHQLCFAIINQGVLRISMGRQMQDRICEALCRP